MSTGKSRLRQLARLLDTREQLPENVVALVLTTHVDGTNKGCKVQVQVRTSDGGVQRVGHVKCNVRVWRVVLLPALLQLCDVAGITADIGNR